jgi:aminodeoxychorismate lyase
MIIWLNGRFLPEEEAVVSVLDRGFLFGDGLFETLRVHRGIPFCWTAHLERLQQGANFLGIKLLFTPQDLLAAARGLVEMNQVPEAILRLTVSRGVGPRGYSPRGADRPVLVMTLAPAPVQTADTPTRWRLRTTSLRLPPNQPLARFKTCNKLSQILARAEADAHGDDEALLLSADGSLAEGSSSNLFWVQENVVFTPPPSSGILPGVTREILLQICEKIGVPVRQTTLAPEALLRMDGVFLSLSTLGVVEATSLDNRPLQQSPLITKLHRAYQERLARESP